MNNVWTFFSKSRCSVLLNFFGFEINKNDSALSNTSEEIMTFEMHVADREILRITQDAVDKLKYRSSLLL